MSERLFEAFREDAERLTEVPAFEVIEQQGRALRRRRHAVIGAVAAMALAVTGVVATTAGEPRTQQPAGPGVPSVMPFPSFEMTTLAEGTYEVAPSVSPARPLVRFTVPEGWNAWQGPNRFEGIGAVGTDNEDVLDMTDWYAGLLVLEVEWIAAPKCDRADIGEVDAAGLVRALTKIPHLKVISGPDRMTRFGYSATHLRLRSRESAPGCPEFTFSTIMNDSIGLQGDGITHDAWVIDVGDRPFLVWATWTRRTPRAEVDDLQSIVDTIEVHERP